MIPNGSFVKPVSERPDASEVCKVNKNVYMRIFRKIKQSIYDPKKAIY